MSAAALVLAAGAGRRFGAEPKLLADLGGRPVLDHVLATVRRCAALARVVVVLGANAEAIRAQIDLDGLEAVDCPDWDEGQAASLRCGLRALGEADKVLVLLGDQPLVTEGVIARMAAEPPGSRAAYAGAPGHPAVLGPDLVERALGLHGDVGLRDAAWRLVECAHLADPTDIDTPADLEAIR